MVTVFNGKPLDVTVGDVSISYGRGFDMIGAMAYALASMYVDPMCPCDVCTAAREEEAKGEVRH